MKSIVAQMMTIAVLCVGSTSASAGVWSYIKKELGIKSMQCGGLFVSAEEVEAGLNASPSLFKYSRTTPSNWISKDAAYLAELCQSVASPMSDFEYQGLLETEACGYVVYRCNMYREPQRDDNGQGGSQSSGSGDDGGSVGEDPDREPVGEETGGVVGLQ